MSQLEGWSLPSLLGEGEVASQMMSCWTSESLCGDSPLKTPPGLDLGILVGVLKSGGEETQATDSETDPQTTTFTAYFTSVKYLQTSVSEVKVWSWFSVLLKDTWGGQTLSVVSSEYWQLMVLLVTDTNIIYSAVLLLKSLISVHMENAQTLLLLSSSSVNILFKLNVILPIISSGFPVPPKACFQSYLHCWWICCMPN